MRVTFMVGLADGDGRILLAESRWDPIVPAARLRTLGPS